MTAALNTRRQASTRPRRREAEGKPPPNTPVRVHTAGNQPIFATVSSFADWSAVIKSYGDTLTTQSLVASLHSARLLAFDVSPPAHVLADMEQILRVLGARAAQLNPSNAMGVLTSLGHLCATQEGVAAKLLAATPAVAAVTALCEASMRTMPHLAPDQTTRLFGAAVNLSRCAPAVVGVDR